MMRDMMQHTRPHRATLAASIIPMTELEVLKSHVRDIETAVDDTDTVFPREVLIPLRQLVADMSPPQRAWARVAAARLWNAAIRRTRYSTSSCDELPDLRQLAAQVMACSGTSRVDDLVKMIMMWTATGRAWLGNATHEDNRADPAEAARQTMLAGMCFDKAQETWERIAALHVDARLLEPVKQHVLSLTLGRVKLILLSSAASAADEALQTVHAALAVLQAPEHRATLAMTAYNAGIRELGAEQAKPEQASRWLTVAADVYQDVPQRDPSKQARVLRALAASEAMRGEAERALNAADMANALLTTNDGYVVRAHALIRLGRHDDAHAELYDNLLLGTGRNDPSWGSSVCDAVDLVTKEWGIGDDRTTRFQDAAVTEAESTPDALAQLRVHMLLAAHAWPWSDHKVAALNAALSWILDARASFTSLSEARVSTIVASAWNTAMVAHATQRWHDVLDWLAALQRVLGNGDVEETATARAHALRMASGCYIQLERKDDAAEALQQACTAAPNLAQIQYARFHFAATVAKEPNAALDALQALARCQDATVDHLLLAAHQAYAAGMSGVVRHVLALASEEPFCAAMPVDKRVHVLVDMLRLVYTGTFDQEDDNLGSLSPEIVAQAHRCADIIAGIADLLPHCSAAQRSASAAMALNIANSLFHRISQDTSTPVSDVVQCHTAAAAMCQHAWAFCEAGVGPDNVHQQDSMKINALWMAAKARINALLVRRRNNDTNQDDEDIDAINDMLEQCQALMVARPAAAVSNPVLKASSLVTLRFAVAVLRGDDKAACDMADHHDDQLLEMARLAAAGPPCSTTVAEHTFARALEKYMHPGTGNGDDTAETPADEEQVQAERERMQMIAELFHARISISSEKDAFNLAKTALSQIEAVHARGTWPAISIDWLHGFTWNAGVAQYSKGNLVEAEHWLSLSLSLVRHSNRHVMAMARLMPMYQKLLGQIPPQR